MQKVYIRVEPILTKRKDEYVVYSDMINLQGGYSQFGTGYNKSYKNFDDALKDWKYLHGLKELINDLNKELSKATDNILIKEQKLVVVDGIWDAKYEDDSRWSHYEGNLLREHIDVTNKEDFSIFKYLKTL